MAFDIVTFGIPMVELMRRKLDVPMTEVGDFTGPFAAGDPGITLNACTTLGYKGCYVGVVGKDPLAECFLQRMHKSGIDTSRIRVDARHTTGISLLAKFSDGNRSFVFTLPTSAAAQMGPEDFDRELLRQVKWLHVSGFTLSISDSIVELHRLIMREIDDRVMVSFDPNYRKDIIELKRYQLACREVFERCNLFLPSTGEAGLFCPGASDERSACGIIAGKGKMVALKCEARGCYGFAGGRELYVPAFPIEEVDPTGAGDTFGGALIAKLLDGADFFAALPYAAAAGALAVNRIGLMDIAPNRGEIQELLARHSIATP